jgi:hypothetical protein
MSAYTHSLVSMEVEASGGGHPMSISEASFVVGICGMYTRMQYLCVCDRLLTCSD